MKVGFVEPSAFVLGGLATWLDQLLPRRRTDGWSPWFLPMAGLECVSHTPVTDALWLARRRVLGAAKGMVGGEEWPSIYFPREATQTRRFEEASAALDYAEQVR